MVDTSILGIDVWDGYGEIDWEKVRAAGIRFAWIRATGYVGKNGTDARTKANVAGARATSVAPGLYHVWQRSQDPVRAADSAYDHAEGVGLRVGELPPAIDVEVPANPVAKPGQDQKKVSEAWLARMQADGPAIVFHLERMVDAFERRFGRAPVIYTYPSWWRALAAAGISSRRLAECGLWIAHYTSQLPLVLPATLEDLHVKLRPTIPAPWSLEQTVAWQYSAPHSFRLEGIPTGPCKTHKGCTPLDRCVFFGDEVAFARFRGMVPVEPNEVSIQPDHGTHVVESVLEQRNRQ